MILLRRLLGDTLRQQRLAQERTLRDVSAGARVSLGYLSEVERGQKEASSELLSSICDALGVQLSAVLREVSDELQVLETAGATRGVRCRMATALAREPPGRRCRVSGALLELRSALDCRSCRARPLTTVNTSLSLLWARSLPRWCGEPRDAKPRGQRHGAHARSSVDVVRLRRSPSTAAARRRWATSR